jgi:uncharacterized protein (DUF849 family)
MSESAHELKHLEFAKQRVMVMSAPNGARRTALDHPAIPLTAADMAQNARDLEPTGISVLHLHVRDDQAGHTLDVGRYRASTAAIRKAVGDRLVIQVTTEAVGMYKPQQQMAMVRELRPEAVSLALNELCPDPVAETGAARFFRWLKKEHIWPQYILYSPAELQRFDTLRRAGVFGEDHPCCLLVLGSYLRQVEGTADELDSFLAAADCGQFPWAACCFGKEENQVMIAALKKGGHVRLGFENNLWLPDGQLARDNAQLAGVFVNELAGHGRSPASADEVREAFF